MGAGSGEHLHIAGDSLLHRLPASVKLVGLFCFVLGVVAVPGPAYLALGVLLCLATGILLSTAVPVRHLLPRLGVEVPFLVFALVMPFVALGPRTRVGPFELSIAGLEGAWTIAAKGTVGVLCGVAFAVTTSSRDFVAALQRLRVPGLIIALLSFMIRYTDVVLDEMRRMRIARESRGFTPGSVRGWPVLATGLGALFIRSYERGERVHLAMLSRGYTGSFALADEHTIRPGQWIVALSPAAVSAAVAIAVRSI